MPDLTRPLRSESNRRLAQEHSRFVKPATSHEVAISRNGTLYFSSTRAGGAGDIDIYRARPVDGRWTVPANPGAPINSAYWDIYPSISPDGKYLFFTRRKAWKTDEDSDIHWVSASFIERLRKAAVAR